MVEENVFVLYGVWHPMECGTPVFFCCYKPVLLPLNDFYHAIHGDIFGTSELCVGNVMSSFTISISYC